MQYIYSNKNVLQKSLSAILLFLSISTSYAAVDMPNGEFHETYEDLVVKVMGGHVKVERTWYEGRWHFNRAWNPIQIERNTTTNSIIRIQRNLDKYEAQSSAGTFLFDERKSIVNIENGFRWKDRNGSWIEYDNNGRLTRYGDRNDVQVSFQYDTQGRRTGVFDHFGNQVLWYEYDGTTNRVSAIRDHADVAQSRRVQYQYTGEQLTTVINVLGHPWTYTYTNNRLTRITDPEGRPTNIDYHANGKTKSVTLADGTGTFYEFDYDKTRKEYFVRTSYSSGKILEHWYNTEGEIVRRDINGTTVETVVIDGRRYISTNELGHRTIRENDEWNNLIKITHPDNSTRTFTYGSVYSNILSETNERGVITRYEYDARGNRIRKTEAYGRPEQRITVYEPDIYGNTLSIRRLGDLLTEEALTTYSYDPINGNMVSKTIRVSSSENHTTSYLEYDRAGNLLQWRDARNNLWRADYDAKGQLRNVTDPMLHVINYDYDRSGKRISTTNTLGHATTWFYDTNGRLNQIRDAENNHWRVDYASSGLKSAEYDPEGRLLKETNYDSNGRLNRTTDGAGNSITYNYGVNTADNVSYSQLASVTMPTYTQHYRYDARGRRTTVINILDETTQYITEQHYDAGGNLTIVIDAELKQTHYEFDGNNRRTRIEHPDGTDVEYVYDNRDNLLSVINEKGIVIRRYEYDQKNRLKREIFPGGEIIQYFHDENDNLIRKVDAKGQVAAYYYDIANRLQNIRYYPRLQAYINNEPASKVVNFSYDDVNRLIGYSDAVTSASYTYNNVGQRLTEVVNLPGNITASHAYTYYRNGIKMTHTGPDNITYTYTYDASNRLSGINLPNEGAIAYNQYKWDAPELITLPGNNTIHYNYDSLLRLQDIQILDAAENELMNYRYDYDRVGNIRTKQTEHGIYEYDYDLRYRLSDSNNPTRDDEVYTYDRAGNRITSFNIFGNWVYDDDNKLRSYGGVDFDYDDNGSRTAKFLNNSLIQRFVYNLENRLSEVRDGNNALVASYYYDPFGRRLWKEVSGNRTYFIYSSDKLSAELDSAGNVTYSYGYSSEIEDTPLFVKTANGYRYYLNDHLATPQQKIDNTGARTWVGRQLAFGDTQEILGTGQNNLRFPGQYYDAETGLHYNYFRYYDSETGMYISSDPIGLKGGINAYLYVRNNPIVYTDPYGLFCVPELGIPCCCGIPEQIDREFTKPLVKTAKAVWASIECEAECVADFVVPGWRDVAAAALETAANEVAKGVAEETAKMAIKAVTKRVNFAITVYDASVGVRCLVRCQKKDDCELDPTLDNTYP